MYPALAATIILVGQRKYQSFILKLCRYNFLAAVFPFVDIFCCIASASARVLFKSG